MQIGDWHGTGFGLLDQREARGVNVAGLTHNAPKFSTQPLIEPLPPLTQIGGTCYAFATVNYIRYTCRNLPLRSGLALGWLSHKVMGVSDANAAQMTANGGYVRAAVGAALAWGLPAESDHRDLDENIEIKNNVIIAKKPTIEAMMGAFYDATLCYDSIHQLRASDAQDMAALGIPSIVCTAVTDEIYKAAVDGSKLTGAGTFIGAHAWVLIGPNTLQSTWGSCGRDGMGLFEASDDYIRGAFDIWTGVPIWATK